MKELKGVVTPQRAKFSTHVFHQYTLIVENGKRDDLKQYLLDNDIPSMIYYPVPLYQQKAYEHYVSKDYRLPITEYLCESVLSLPVCPELKIDDQEYIINTIQNFFQQHG